MIYGWGAMLGRPGFVRLRPDRHRHCARRMTVTYEGARMNRYCNGGDRQSVAIITSLALMTAWTSLPTVRLRRSADSLVMIATTSSLLASSTVTSVLTAPG